MGEEMHKITRHFEHVARCIENHKRPSSRNVLKSDDTIEFLVRQRYTGWPTGLDGLSINSAAILQNLAHADTERIFVDTWPAAITRDRHNLGTCRFKCAD